MFSTKLLASFFRRCVCLRYTIQTSKDLKTIFLPLFLIRSQRKIELGLLFACELLAVYPAFIDGQGCLHESIDYKPGQVKSPDMI